MKLLVVCMFSILLMAANPTCNFWEDCVLGGFGCDCIPCPKPGGDVNPSVPIEPPVDYCRQYFKVAVGGTGTVGRFYWLGLLRNDSLYKHGDSLYMAPGSFENETLGVVVTYLDNVPPGRYTLRVMGTDTASQVGVLGKFAVADDAGIVEIMQFATGGDNVCCTPGRKYVQFQKRIDALLGTRARIRIRFGSLCRGTSSTDSAMSLACTSVAHEDSTIPYGYSWAQTGFRVERSGSYTYYTSYAEIASDSVQIKFDFSVPAEYFSYEYSCDLDPTTSAWTFKKDGVTAYSGQFVNDSYWVNRSGEYAMWYGEILNKEDDMPGTGSSRCGFGGISYRVGSQFQPSEYNTSDVTRTDDATEWGYSRMAADSFEIWDLRPNQ